MVMAVALPMLSACSYLDVIPPEQPGLDDTMDDADAVRNFLYSCYSAVEGSGYMEDLSTDELVMSDMIGSANQKIAWNQLTSSSTDDYGWNKYYNAIGQCHLFQEELAEATPLGVTDEMKAEYNAQADFLIAYYHFKLLSRYGPIPVIDRFMPADTPKEEMPGRSHFDYVVNFICNKLDNAAKLMAPDRNSSEWGLATSTICYALKARVLLYAASDLWNGGFPETWWRNTNYETPGYGYELVSHTYSREKWEKALEACDYAIKWAESEGGNSLLKLENMPARAANITYPYIPGKEGLTDADKDPMDGDFKDYVMLMSLLLQSTPAEGNREYIWGENPYNEIDTYSYLPLNIMQRSGTWVTGYSLISPTLYIIEHFYTENGELPALDDDFPTSDEWFTSAGIAEHPDIIKLCTGREPRFYAWLGFDGGEYSSMIKDGQSLFLNMKSSSAQGRNPQSNRNYSVSGFLTKKHIEPDLSFTQSGTDANTGYPVPLIRLAELYLNRAECYAELDMTDEALADLNEIRTRAGVRELEASDITDDMTIVDWVRNERCIELFQEGHRYYDVRRWMLAPELLGEGAREGLNVMEKYDPTFEEFNKRVTIDQPFTWDDRMYLLPVYADEVYSNPQMIQAPGY